GDRFLPTPWTRSIWDPNSLRGPVISGLLMYQVEQRHFDPLLQVSRVTIDMFRLAPMVPVTVETRVARDGNRIRVVDATVVADGLDIARASVVMLRRTPPPEGTVWAPPSWDVPLPDALPAPDLAGARIPIWEQRMLTARDSGADGPAPRRAWLRDVVDFVRGERASALVRAAMMSDYANPFANGSDQGLNYINADASLYLHRDPVGDWIGVAAIAHGATEGIAVGECALYDLDGPFGRTTVASLANRRRT
ncbi:MAG: acyl-CoA thioesterase domain-containing protein, partial [Dehalococcoidia bacterium]